METGKWKMGMALALLVPAALLAGPAEKVDPVAEGYPTWTGVTAKNYVQGRELCPSDLRHKGTIVIEIEPSEKLVDKFEAMIPLVTRSSSVSLGFGANWEDTELPRDFITVISLKGMGKKEVQSYKDLLANKDKSIKDKNIVSTLARISGCTTYCGLSFAGAPDTTGKCPYVYVFGPTGAAPIAHGPLATSMKDINAAIATVRKEISGWDPKWRPFYGNISEPKFNTTLAKTLEKGKKAKKSPLDPVAKGLLSDVKSSDAEKAKEAQILYDAIEQTRSDLVLRIGLEAGACPHRAYYDIQQLLKYWPSESKRVEEALKRIETAPNAKMMGELFTKLKEWGDPSFTCKNAGEAKAIVAKLQKMKKTLAPVKESTNITAQNGALLLDMRIDDLITQMPNKVASK